MKNQLRAIESLLNQLTFTPDHREFAELIVEELKYLRTVAKQYENLANAMLQALR
jgi:hypothetical protein